MTQSCPAFRETRSDGPSKDCDRWPLHKLKKHWQEHIAFERMGNLWSALAGPGPDGRNFLIAIEHGNAPVVKHYLDKAPELLLIRSYNGETPFHLAARDGKAPVLAVIISILKERLQQSSRAQHICNRDKLQFVDFISQLLNRRLGKGYTALHLAAYAGQEECVKLLLEAGADPWVPDRFGCRTALHIAASRGHAAVVRELLRSDPGPPSALAFRRNIPGTRYVDVRAYCGLTPLHFAVFMGKTEAVEVLLHWDPQVTAITVDDGVERLDCNSHSTALHIAARRGDTEIARLLLAYMANHPGADLRRLADCMHKVPYVIALEAGHWLLAEMLRPGVPLEQVVSQQDIAATGAPRLSVLAACALNELVSRELSEVECSLQCDTPPHCSSSPGLDINPRRSDQTEEWDIPTSEQQQRRRRQPQPGQAQSQPPPFGCRWQDLDPSPNLDVLDTTAWAAPPGMQLLGSSEGSGKLWPVAERFVGDNVEEEEEEEACCGVCLDAPATACMKPCGHNLCVECLRHVVALHPLEGATCPFCRGLVGGVVPRPHTLSCAAGVVAKERKAHGGRQPTACDGRVEPA